MNDIIKTAQAIMKTKYGEFKVIAFSMTDGLTHLALIHGSGTIPIVRIQSHCLLGTAFKSIDCDCGVQIDLSLSFLSSQDYSIMIYLDQEGRGYGLFSKIEILSVMNQGKSLFDSQKHLKRDTDIRSYECVKDILKHLNINEITLLAGNSKKVALLKNMGIKINDIIDMGQLISGKNSMDNKEH